MLWLYASPVFEEACMFAPPRNCYLNTKEKEAFAACALCKATCRGVANPVDPSMVLLDGDKWLAPYVAYLIGDMMSLESREAKLKIAVAERLGIPELERMTGSVIDMDVYAAVWNYVELCVRFGLCINKMFTGAPPGVAEKEILRQQSEIDTDVPKECACIEQAR